MASERGGRLGDENVVTLVGSLLVLVGVYTFYALMARMKFITCAVTSHRGFLILVL